MKSIVIVLAICGLGVASGMAEESSRSEERREGVVTTVVDIQDDASYQISARGDIVTFLREGIETSYECRKVFVGLEPHKFFSYAIYQLFANIEGEEREVSARFVDKSNPLENKKVIVSNFSADDNALMSYGKVETYVMLDGNKVVVSTEEYGSIPYESRGTERDSSTGLYTYTYRRADGTLMIVESREEQQDTTSAEHQALQDTTSVAQQPIAGTGPNNISVGQKIEREVKRAAQNLEHVVKRGGEACERCGRGIRDAVRRIKF